MSECVSNEGHLKISGSSSYLSDVRFEAEDGVMKSLVVYRVWC